MYNRFAHMPVWWREFLNSESLFPNNSSLYQVDIKLAKAGNNSDIFFFLKNQTLCKLSSGFNAPFKFFFSKHEWLFPQVHIILADKSLMSRAHGQRPALVFSFFSARTELRPLHMGGECFTSGTSTALRAGLKKKKKLCKVLKSPFRFHKWEL